MLLEIQNWREHSSYRNLGTKQCFVKSLIAAGLAFGVKLASSNAAKIQNWREHSSYRNLGTKQCFVKSLNYSHSIVAGGLEDTSYTTRETSAISFMIRVEILSTKS